MNRIIPHIRPYSGMSGLFAAVVALLLMMASCSDDLLYDNEEPGEGIAGIKAEVRFSPMVVQEVDQTEAPTRSDGMVFAGEEGVTNGDNTVAPAGDAMDNIRNLVILFYDAQGNLSTKMLPVTVDLTKYQPKLEEREGGEQTYCVSFPLDVKYGDYKIFAVANVADLLTAHSDEISTADGLRNIKLKWVANNIGSNCEMFGIMTADKSDTRGMNFETDHVVSVRPGVTMLHSWVRRAVSKLTIDFDGTGLLDNVYVYIKEAKLYDIADGCCLGRYSCVGDAPKGSGTTGGFGIAGSSHRLVYGKGTDYKGWPVVVKDSKLSFYKKGETEINYHDDLAYCLPFYENMQGDGKLKYQDSDRNGMVDYPDAGDYTLESDGTRKWLHEEAKDSKPNGTYVEVTGYYRSENANYVSEGPIKFRFMLGKNVDDNYDCERNHHYKLTLNFRGNGNDADWHIEYKDEKGIYLPKPLYISYLYNHEMKLPLRINTGGAKVKNIKIKIKSNNWAPHIPNYDKEPYNYYRQIDINQGFGVNAPYNGFLSLIKTSDTMIAGPGGDADYTYNKVYYEKTITDPDGYEINRGERIYNVDPGTHGDDKVGEYTIKRGRNVIEAVIPLYTRAKQMVSRTGYTGNNPFENYERRALIEVTAELEDGEEIPAAQTEIFQVRRVVNPKGVYRKNSNSTPFDVTLMELHGEYATKFDELKSHGSWRAYVIAGDQNFINLDGKQEVEGNTNTTVKFRINFNGTCDADKSRFAIIRVEYHNYNCVHLIFVRQEIPLYRCIRILRFGIHTTCGRRQPKWSHPSTRGRCSGSGTGHSRSMLATTSIRIRRIG